MVLYNIALLHWLGIMLCHVIFCMLPGGEAALSCDYALLDGVGHVASLSCDLITGWGGCLSCGYALSGIGHVVV